MSRRRRYSGSRWLILWSFLGALALEGAIGGIYELVREEPKPLLFVDLDGEGSGTVLSVPEGIDCGKQCVHEFPRGTAIELTAILDEGSTFEGWPDGCEVDQDWVLTCRLKLEQDTHIAPRFGLVPDQVQVSWAVAPPLDADHPEKTDDALDITLPDLDEEVRELEQPKKQPPKPPEPPVNPTPPPPQLATQAVPVPADQPKPLAVPPQPPQMKSVEVPDEHEVDKAPDDAQYLSDKNRDVAEQTRATDTNLVAQRNGETSASEESDVQSDEVGGKEDEIAQLEDVDPTSLEAERTREFETRGRDDIGEVPRGEGGDEGEEGDGHDRGHGVLAMRGIQGRGALGGPVVEDPGRGGKKGRRGIKTELDQEDYEHIVGKELATREVELGRQKKSMRRGRFERKQAAVRAALENFIPEVRPGNQTALKTRAAPFALYVNRMHRRIHELWGFGFLEELDGRPATDPMNNRSLQTIIEIAINPDGTVHKTTIVSPSGILMFDVAAIDAILTAAPYEETPEKIRSVDGRVWLHWVFRRDWEQCGTFNVRTYILSEVREGGIDDGDMVRAMRDHKRAGGHPATDRWSGDAGTPEAGDTPVGPDTTADSARAMANLPAPDDPYAEHAADLWMTGFTHGDLKKMMRVTGTPFTSGGEVVANTEADVVGMYRTILAESGGAVRESKLLSPAGYRKHFGQLPPGLEVSGENLLLVVQTKSERFTLVLARQPNGEYKVVGFQR